MRVALAAALLAVCGWLGAVPAWAQPPDRPLLIAEARWDPSPANAPANSVLRVFPTALGRTYDAPDGADIAWAQVLALAPAADSPGMRMQFDCHWYGRAFIPDKPSWNLEPWRPVVDETLMTLAQCNPGGPEI
jgi:hypothetical protein